MYTLHVHDFFKYKFFNSEVNQEGKYNKWEVTYGIMDEIDTSKWRVSYKTDIALFAS